MVAEDSLMTELLKEDKDGGVKTLRDETVIDGSDKDGDVARLTDDTVIDGSDKDGDVVRLPGKIVVTPSKLLAFILVIDVRDRDGDVARVTGEIVVTLTKPLVPRLVIDGKDRVVETRDSDSRGTEAIELVSVIGFPSGPTLTARLASITTVLVPLRRAPVARSPKPCVNVHTPSE